MVLRRVAAWGLLLVSLGGVAAGDVRRRMVRVGPQPEAWCPIGFALDGDEQCAGFNSAWGFPGYYETTFSAPASGLVGLAFRAFGSARLDNVMIVPTELSFETVSGNQRCWGGLVNDGFDGTNSPLAVAPTFDILDPSRSPQALFPFAEVFAGTEADLAARGWSLSSARR